MDKWCKVEKTKYHTEVLFNTDSLPGRRMIGFAASSGKQAKASVDETEDDGLHWVAKPYVDLDGQSYYVGPVFAQEDSKYVLGLKAKIANLEAQVAQIRYGKAENE